MTYYKIFSLPTSSFLEAAKAFDTFYKDHMANIDLFLTSTDPEMAAILGNNLALRGGKHLLVCKLGKTEQLKLYLLMLILCIQ